MKYALFCQSDYVKTYDLKDEPKFSFLPLDRLCVLSTAALILLWGLPSHALFLQILQRAVPACIAQLLLAVAIRQQLRCYIFVQRTESILYLKHHISFSLVVRQQLELLHSYALSR